MPAYIVHAQENAQTSPQTDLCQTVMERGILRCGYHIWPPYFEIVEEGETFQGLSYDIAEYIADKMGLEIKWILEIQPGEQVQALKSGKIDAICGGNAIPGSS